jgi:hypothetical protein
MRFEILGPIRVVESIARGPGVRVLSYLREAYGRGRWRKLEGVATVRLEGGHQHEVEPHGYEAHGIGKRDLKIKSYLD